MLRLEILIIIMVGDLLRITSYIITLYLMRTLIAELGTAVLLTCAKRVSTCNYNVAFFLLMGWFLTGVCQDTLSSLL